MVFYCQVMKIFIFKEIIKGRNNWEIQKIYYINFDFRFFKVKLTGLVLGIIMFINV